MEIVSSSCGPSVTLFLLHSEDLDGGYGSAEMQPERRARRRNAGRLWPPCPPLHSGLKALNLRGMGTESPSCVGALPRHKLMVSQSSGMILGKPISSKEKLFHD